MDTLPRQPRYDKEETARRAEEIFERDIRPHVAGKDERWFVAIDIETGDYEVAPNELTATDAVLARHPNARLWLRRVGSPYVYHFGYHRKTA